MPVKSTKLLEAVKGTTVISTYVTGAPVAPAAGTLAVYVDLAATDQHRAVEVAGKLTNLIDRAREAGFNRPSVTTQYYRMPIDGGKDSIVATTTSTDIVEGDVAIGIEGSVLAGGRGSILLDSCFRQLIDWMSEQDRLTV